LVVNYILCYHLSINNHILVIRALTETMLPVVLWP